MSSENPRESKTYPGQTPRDPGKPVIKSWFLPFKRGVSNWGFVLNRIAGLGLVLYLYMHMLFLYLFLTRGPEIWETFLATMSSPLVKAGESVLIAAIVGHGLNGFRVALVGTGMLTKKQRVLFYVVISIAVILGVIGIWLLFAH